PNRAQIAKRTVGHEGVEQSGRLEEVDEERQLPKRRHRRLLVPLDPDRPEKTVQVDPFQPLRHNHRLLTRPVSPRRRRVALHALENARFSPSRQNQTAVSRFNSFALQHTMKPEAVETCFLNDDDRKGFSGPLGCLPLQLGKTREQRRDVPGSHGMLRHLLAGARRQRCDQPDGPAQFQGRENAGKMGLDSDGRLSLVGYGWHARLQSAWFATSLCPSVGRYPPPHGILCEVAHSRRPTRAPATSHNPPDSAPFRKSFDRISGIDSSRLVKTNRNFLSAADRADLVKIVRDGLEEHRIVRRANAILLLDKGWSYAEVAEALFLDDSTIRIWLKEFQEGGVEAIVLFDLKGGTGRLSPLQIDELRAWATETLPTSTTEIGQFILDRFGFDYGRSGLIKLMNRIGFDWKKPESVPGKIDVETQQKFIDAHEDLRNSLGPDETVVYVDAVHPTHQAKPAGRWLPRGQRCALPATSGRDRLNLHGAIDLETGQTRIMDVQTVDAASTIALFEALERANSTMSRIHVFLDNARYHHARAVRGWLQQPGRRIVLHFVPSYCPHLNPIERLWKVMHENVTHNRCYAKFRDFAEAVLGFLRETVPSRFDEFSSSITDNFRVINPKDFRILA